MWKGFYFYFFNWSFFLSTQFQPVCKKVVNVLQSGKGLEFCFSIKGREQKRFLILLKGHNHILLMDKHSPGVFSNYFPRIIFFQPAINILKPPALNLLLLSVFSFAEPH